MTTLDRYPYWLLQTHTGLDAEGQPATQVLRVPFLTLNNAMLYAASPASAGGGGVVVNRDGHALDATGAVDFHLQPYDLSTTVERLTIDITNGMVGTKTSRRKKPSAWERGER
jgi:hypothetical protein